MSGRSDYQGKGVGLVDDKGRVAIPNTLRASLARNAPREDGKDGGSVIVAPHPKLPCLIAYDPAFLPILKARLDERERAREARGAGVDYGSKTRGAAGEQVPFDGSGRFILPGFERSYAGIEDVAFFHGSFDWIEIWDPRALVETPDADPLLVAEARWCCREKGVAL